MLEYAEALAYRIAYEQRARAHLRALAADERARVLDGIERYLAHEAEVEPRNGQRKRMRPNSVAQGRLRLDPLRVYYDVAGATVIVKAVGTKRRERVVAPTGEELLTNE